MVLVEAGLERAVMVETHQVTLLEMAVLAVVAESRPVAARLR